MGFLKMLKISVVLFFRLVIMSFVITWAKHESNDCLILVVRQKEEVCFYKISKHQPNNILRSRDYLAKKA